MGMAALSCSSGASLAVRIASTKVRTSCSSSCVPAASSRRRSASSMDMALRYGRVVVIGSRGPVEIMPRETMMRDADIRGMTLMNAGETELKGIHAAIIEVDPDLCAVKIRKYLCIHDCGNMINPMMVEVAAVLQPK